MHDIAVNIAVTVVEHNNKIYKTTPYLAPRAADASTLRILEKFDLILTQLCCRWNPVQDGQQHAVIFTTFIMIVNIIGGNVLETWGAWTPNSHPDSKVHGANMGPIWGPQDPGGPHVGPMNFAIWDMLLTKFTGTLHDPWLPLMFMIMLLHGIPNNCKTIAPLCFSASYYSTDGNIPTLDVLEHYHLLKCVDVQLIQRSTNLITPVSATNIRFSSIQAIVFQWRC